MTSPITTIKTLLLSTILTIVVMGNQSPAQKPSTNTNPITAKNSKALIIKECITLMEQKQCQNALNILNPLIEQNKETGLKKYGAKFATIYYYKGLCLLKLAQIKNKENNQTTSSNTNTKKDATATQLFQAAIQALNQCFAINPPNDNSNTYRAKSLLLRGNAQQSLEQYQQAINSYKLFILERNSALDPYNLSDFNINLAICLWKKNSQKNTTPTDTQKAIDLLQKSLLYTGSNQPSPLAALTALQTLTKISISTKNDTLIPSITQRTNNPILPVDQNNQNISPKILSSLSNLILQTAKKNLPLTSLHLSTFVPGISQHKKELEIPNKLNILTRKNINPNNATKKILAEAIATALQARALSLQKTNKKTAAIHLYTILVEQYSATTHQPENLYNLARLATLTGDTATTISRARQFLNNHPHHTLKNPTTTILLNTLYHKQKYQKSLTLAKQSLSDLQTKTTNITEPSAILLKDTASFIHAASHYYLGNFTTAAPLLATHQTNFPDSPYGTDSAYLNAAVQNQLLHWHKSIPLLRKFITSNNKPEAPSIYIPFAHYDIAYAQYSQRHIHSAILSLLPFTLDIPFTTDLAKPFTKSQISPSAAILLGNTHLLLRQPETAIVHYQHAIQLAKDTGNIPTRDEAYYLLINLLGKPLWNGLTNHRLQETIPYYLNFLALENAKTSPYFTQILTSAITALEKADPDKPVHLLLQENLFQHNNTPNTAGIETALKTYLYYLKKYLTEQENPTQEIIRILTENIKTTTSTYHQALITTAKIEALENHLKLTRNPKPGTQTQIHKLYSDLINQYLPKDLDNFTLLKVATHLAKNNNSAQATEYYQAILRSNSNIKKTEARLAIAIQLATSNNPEQKQTARTQLTEILNNPFTPTASLATARYHIIQLLRQQQNWQEIETNTLAYLKYPLNAKTHNLEILQLLAKAYDKQGKEKIDSAISTYTHIWVKTLFSIQHSAPAIDRACQLLWERNNPAKQGIQQGKSDRQLAYETAYKYIRQTKDHLKQRKKSLPKSAIQTWQKIKTNATKIYPNEPSVKPFSSQP